MEDLTDLRVRDTRTIIIKVGFAAETQDLIENARDKVVRKRLALICANDATAPDARFAVDASRVTILHATGKEETNNAS